MKKSTYVYLAMALFLVFCFWFFYPKYINIDGQGIRTNLEEKEASTPVEIKYDGYWQWKWSKGDFGFYREYNGELKLDEDVYKDVYFVYKGIPKNPVDYLENGSSKFLGSMYFKKDLGRFIIIIHEMNGKAKERIAFPAQDAEDAEKLYEDFYKELFKYLKKKY